MSKKPQYKFLGNIVGQAKSALFGQLQEKINQALGMGIPQANIDRVLKNNALKTKQAEERAALLRAGSAAAAQASDNISRGLTAARTDVAYQPGQSALGKLGEGYAGVQDAEARYQDRLSQIDQAAFDRSEEERIRKLDEVKEGKGDNQTKQQAVQLAYEAKDLINKASIAGDFVNGYVELSEEQKATVDGAESGALGRLGDLFKTGIQTAAGAFDQTRRVRQEALERLASTAYPESYQAYIQLKNVANRMVFPILESGALGVNPTDADVELARKSTFDVTSPSNTWDAQLDTIIKNNGGSPKTAASYIHKDVMKSKFENNNNKSIVETLTSPEVLGSEDTSTPQVTVTDEANYSDRHQGSGPLSATPINISASLADKLSGKLPKAAKRLAIKTWMRFNSHNLNTVVTFDGKTGTIKQLLEALGEEF